MEAKWTRKRCEGTCWSDRNDFFFLILFWSHGYKVTTFIQMHWIEHLRSVHFIVWNYTSTKRKRWKYKCQHLDNRSPSIGKYIKGGNIWRNNDNLGTKETRNISLNGAQIYQKWQIRKNTHLEILQWLSKYNGNILKV